MVDYEVPDNSPKKFIYNWKKTLLDAQKKVKLCP